MIQTYKILNRVDDVDPSYFFSPNKAEVTRGADSKLYVEYAKTNTRKFSFGIRVVSLWNALACHIKKATNLNTFKSLLDRDWKFSRTFYCFDE